MKNMSPMYLFGGADVLLLTRRRFWRRELFRNGFWRRRSRLKFFGVQKDLFVLDHLFDRVVVGLRLREVLQVNITLNEFTYFNEMCLYKQMAQNKQLNIDITIAINAQTISMAQTRQSYLRCPTREHSLTL